MKKFSRRTTKTLVKTKIKQLMEQGFDTSKLTNIKSIDQWSWSQKAYNEFKKNVKRLRQRPLIEKEVKAYDEKVRRTKTLKSISLGKNKPDKKKIKPTSKKDIITSETESLMKFNHEGVSPSPQNIKKLTQDTISDFLHNKYFRSVAGVNLKERLDKLSAKFGSRLDLVYDFIDDVTQIDFNYEIDGMVLDRGTFESDFADDWEDMMEERLQAMEGLLKTRKYKL